MRSKIILSLGSNSGDKIQLLNEAIQLINDEIDVPEFVSGFYVTEPWGYADQDPFINLAMGLYTNASPLTLLEKLQEIERRVGSKAEFKWGPREIDIDILFFEDLIFESEHLVIPHPHLVHRNFILQPVTEIYPDFRHPVYNMTIKELLEKSEDRLTCTRLDYV